MGARDEPYGLSGRARIISPHNKNACSTTSERAVIHGLPPSVITLMIQRINAGDVLHIWCHPGAMPCLLASRRGTLGLMAV